MSAPTIQTFDQRQPVMVSALEIRAGDFMRDLGTLREVESVKTADGPCPDRVSVRFVDGTDGQYATLSVPRGIPVTVWRALRSAALSAEAARRAAA